MPARVMGTEPEKLCSGRGFDKRGPFAPGIDIGMIYQAIAPHWHFADLLFQSIKKFGVAFLSIFFLGLTELIDKPINIGCSGQTRHGAQNLLFEGIGEGHPDAHGFQIDSVHNDTIEAGGPHYRVSLSLTDGPNAQSAGDDVDHPVYDRCADLQSGFLSRRFG